MTTTNEVKLPELPKSLLHAVAMHHHQGIRYATGHIPVQDEMEWHEKVLGEVRTYAKQYGTLCYSEWGIFESGWNAHKEWQARAALRSE